MNSKISAKYDNARRRATLCSDKRGGWISDAEIIEFMADEIDRYRETIQKGDDYKAKLLNEIDAYREHIRTLETELTDIRSARVSEIGIPYRQKADLFDKIEKIISVPSEETTITIHANSCEIPTIDYSVRGNPYGCEEIGKHIKRDPFKL